VDNLQRKPATTNSCTAGATPATQQVIDSIRHTVLLTRYR